MPLVEVRILGPVEVFVDGRPVELRRKKQRALLALLALNAGEVVSTDRLVDELWGEMAPKAAIGSLQNLVSELRKLIGTDAVVTRAPGYLLAIEPDEVDAHCFERTVREAQSAETLREALALWRGPPLADLEFEPFAQSAIARLEEVRAVAREELFNLELALGKHAGLIPELEAFVAEHPLRERPRGQLMLALYRSGRQADALEVYRDARTALVEELGLEPSAELQALEQAILRHDPALGLPQAPLRRARVPEPDRRKTVTILFADLVESTELGARLDPEVLRGVLSRYFELVREAVERHGGIIEKFIGDAAMAAFGIPSAHEDDAIRAVRAASELREALTKLNDELTRDRGVALQVRIGLNTGEVLVSDPGAGDFATGPSVNLAMRLEQAARPGEVLLGESTHRLVRHAVESEPIEPVDAGPLGRIPAFRLLGIGEVARPLGTARLVGRQVELAWLRAAFAGVQAERRSKVVTVIGDAGVGKTRLTAEFVGTSGARALVGRCTSYGDGATFLPIAAIVRQAVPERPRAAVAQMFEGDELAPLIAERVTQLTGQAEAAASTGEAFWAVRRLFEALALEQPLVVVLEDIHWAEPTLLELIEYLDAWTAEAPLLVLCLARRELLDERPGWGGPDRLLSLESLGEGEADALVVELAGDELDEVGRARIVEVAEGNPLFLEQLLAFVEEAGTEALEAVPPSVEALIAGRLDRLDPEERALLERAAVIGREFSRAALIHVTPPAELAAVDNRLSRLVRRGLLRPARADRDVANRFHHVLVREVAYSGITKESRADLHERYGSWLEQRDGPDEIVGYHLEQAHRYRAELTPSDPAVLELARRAGGSLGTAGLRAFRRADTRATINLLTRAADLLPGDEPGRAEVLCELGIAHGASGDTAAAAMVLEEASAVADTAGQAMWMRPRLERSYNELFRNRSVDPAEVVDAAHRAIPTFEELGDERALGRAWRMIGYVRGSMQGCCEEWLEAEERAVIHYRRSGWSAAGCLGEAASALYHGPTPVPQALDHMEELLREAADRLGRANVLTFTGALTALSTRFEDAFALLGEADVIYRELGEVWTRANFSGRFLGRCQRLAGDLDSAEETFRDCCETFERVHDEAALSSVGAELAQTLNDQGSPLEAARWAKLAEERAPVGDVIAQFSWRRLKARLLAQEARNDEADRLAREAVALADTTDALTERGETLLQHAHVLLLAGRIAEASDRAEAALELFDRKGDEASAGRARIALAEVNAI
jgi:class 3 adenylate cyclase/tetratricopeptide (TPR) repeat protein